MNYNSNNEKKAGLCIHPKNKLTIQKTIEVKAWCGNKLSMIEDKKNMQHEYRDMNKKLSVDL